MRAAIRTGRPARLPTVMTISSGSSRLSARSATRSRPNARVSRTRWPSTPPARVSTSSRALIEERSKPSCAVSDWPERMRTRATAIWRVTSRPSARAAASGSCIRSIWAYGSQARLLLWGVFAFVLAFVLRFLHGQTATEAIEHGSDSLKPAGDWVAAHGDWFDRAAQILFILGALAIALNLWRALGFSNLLLRGSRLLTQETRERREDLEARAARLNQRVAALTAEADAAAKRAEAASQRAGGVTSMRAPGPEFLESSHAPSGAAREFLAALGAKVGHPGAAGPAPDRLIVVVDNLDALSPAEAVSWIDAAQGVIGPGFIGLLAFDPSRLAAALGEPERGAPASWQMAAGHGQPAGPQGRRRRACGRAPSVGGRAAGARAGSGDRRDAPGAAVEHGNGAACGARAARCAFAARRQALPQRLSSCALFKLAARRCGADAGGGLRRRRRADGDARRGSPMDPAN